MFIRMKTTEPNKTPETRYVLVGDTAQGRVTTSRRNEEPDETGVLLCACRVDVVF